MEEPTVQFSDEELVDNFPTLDDERIQLEDLEFEVEQPSEELEDGSDNSLAKKQSADLETMKKTTTKDRVQALHLRKTLNLLDKMHEEKDVFIQKTK